MNINFLLNNILKKLLMGVITGLFFGFIVYLYQPVTWKANALLSIASYRANIDNGSAFTVLEPTSIVLERLKNDAFLLAASKRVKPQNITHFMNSEVDVKVVKARTADELPGLIVSTHGESADYAIDALSAVIRELQFKHQQLIESYKNSVNQQISAFEDDISSNALRAYRKGTINTQDDVIIAMLKQNLRLSLQHERAWVMSYNLRNTSLLEPIYIKEEKIFRTLPIALLTGLILGTLVGLLAAIAAHRNA